MALATGGRKSYRPAVMGTHYMAASTHYLATAAATRIFEQGGNAIDAGVAAGTPAHAEAAAAVAPQTAPRLPLRLYPALGVRAYRQLWLGMMPGSLKARDLRRDSRLALHSPTDDPSEEDPSSWAGEAKVAGLGVEVTDAKRREEGQRFRVDVTEVVLTRVGEPADHLVIESWHPGRGLERRRRS